MNKKAALQLMYCKLRGGRLIKKTLDSAVANAETQLDARRENLKVHEVRVDCGPILRRAKPRSKGSSVPVNKRTSHFTVYNFLKLHYYFITNISCLFCINYARRYY